MTSAPATRDGRLQRRGEDEFTAERHVYEPHKIGLPPLGPYIRELWRRRDFAREMARTTLQAQHFNTAFGQLWLVLNPLLLAGVYFVLVDILRGGASKPHLDLWSANRDQLIDAGLRPDTIYLCGLSTVSCPDVFDSYRVAGENAGRMAGIIIVPE